MSAFPGCRAAGKWEIGAGKQDWDGKDNSPSRRQRVRLRRAALRREQSPLENEPIPYKKYLTPFSKMPSSVSPKMLR